MVWYNTYKFGFFMWGCVFAFFLSLFLLLFLLQKLVNWLGNKYNHDKNKIMNKISTIFIIITYLSAFFGINVFITVGWILLSIYIIMDKFFIAF